MKAASSAEGPDKTWRKVVCVSLEREVPVQTRTGEGSSDSAFCPWPLSGPAGEPGAVLWAQTPVRTSPWGRFGPRFLLSPPLGHPAPALGWSTDGPAAGPQCAASPLSDVLAPQKPPAGSRLPPARRHCSWSLPGLPLLCQTPNPCLQTLT